MWGGGEREESSKHLWVECEALTEVRRGHQLGAEISVLVEQPTGDAEGYPQSPQVITTTITVLLDFFLSHPFYEINVL